MATFLLFDDSLRSPEMRHEVGEAVTDPIGFLEHEGRRIVVGGVLEEPTFETREDVVDEFWNTYGLGLNDLIKDETFPVELVHSEIMLRALTRAGASTAIVPPTFRVGMADYLRDHGIELVVDDEAWEKRRRRKTPWELEGIERAQRAADTAMLTAARMLRDAERTPDGRLRFEGEILTAELVRTTMVAELTAMGAESEEIIVSVGDACLRGHDIGFGPILPDQSCIIDCFPRDRGTGVYTDMTRTFVPGEASSELRGLHNHCLKALEIAKAAVKPGAKSAHHEVSQYFRSQGFPTSDSHEGDEPLVEGFPYSLGHGVGLEVHEKPRVGRRPDELMVGDVIAIEPGLYFAGIGGVRLEDTVLVTQEGVEHFTDPYPYDLEP
jgi:Xaa-Pro aminopeptidase